MADEAEYTEIPIESLLGGAPSTDPSLIGDLTMEIAAQLTRLHLMLDEADEDEYAAHRRRLDLLRTMVANLPESARRRRKIGFSVTSSNRRRRPR